MAIPEKKQKQKQKKQKTKTKQAKTVTTYNSPCLHQRWRCYQPIALNDQQVGPTSLALAHTVMQTVRQYQEGSQWTNR